MLRHGNRVILSPQAKHLDSSNRRSPLAEMLQVHFVQQGTVVRWRGDVRTYWVYIMTNRSRTLYTGVTGDLARRVYEHRHWLVPGFTSRYQIDRLVHAESFSAVRDAIAREKQIKGWVRTKKLALISKSNPEWRDLGEEWFGPVQ